MLIMLIIPIILTKILKTESNNNIFFGGQKKKERDKAQTKYYSAIESPDKVLQRYTKPPQDIVVYLKSPRRNTKIFFYSCAL